ncbi:PAS domain-containing protein [Parerythrobacter aurantius]|uniref:sensor histidine kinase n=1 Tax=Parerythrobacter aurantius TaxID=3127706 RepID=UPI00324A30DB
MSEAPVSPSAQRPVGGSAHGAERPLSEAYALESAGAAFNALADTMPQIVWSTLPDGSHDYYNRHWYEFTGVPEGSTDGEGWAELFHAEDQPNAWENWRRSLETGEPYEVEYRLRHHSGEYQWMIGRALPIRAADGSIERWIGTCTNVNEQKRVALLNQILGQELSHRIKNIFAVISGLVSLTARNNPGFSDVAQELLGRISALGRAHELVRPHSDKSRREIGDVTLITLIERIFSFYPAYDEGRVRIEGGDVEIASSAATPMALLLHELATNAIKYGSLSTSSGTLTIKLVDRGDTMQLIWTESGAPSFESGEIVPGFGSRLVDLAVRNQLGGNYTRSWELEGLKLDVTIEKARIQAA